MGTVLLCSRRRTVPIVFAVFDVDAANFAGCAYKVFAWDKDMIPLCGAFEGQM